MKPAERTMSGILPCDLRTRSRTRAVLVMPGVLFVSACVVMCLVAFALVAALVGTASWGIAKTLPRRAPSDPKSYLPPEVDRAPRA